VHSTAVVNTEFLRNFNGEATLDELAERIRWAHAAAQSIVANALSSYALATIFGSVIASTFQNF
jgi:hypothetical protein